MTYTLKRLHLFINAFLFCALLSNVAMAQGKGTVTGTITEAESGSSLPGATVFVQGTSLGTITDPYGKYTLTGIPTGSVTIQFSYVGYNDEFVTIEIADGETKEINQVLVMDMVSLGEVVISGQLLGQTKAINEQLNADANVSVVSEEKMKELPDANAAEAIGRISGISLQRNQGEGSKVVLRGLEPKFSNITINGVKVPSNDPDDRSVDLSMISPEMLQGIEVFKSPTPDMDGDAVGGTVNLRINKAPAEPKLKLKTGGGYNQLRNDFKDYYFSGSYSRRFMESKLGVLVQANTERVNRSSNDVNTRYSSFEGYVPDTAIYTQADNADIRKTNELRKRNGISGNIDYQLDKGSISLYSFYNQTARDIDQWRNRADVSDLRHYAYRRRIESDVTSFMLNGDYALGIVKTDANISYAKSSNVRPYDYTAQWDITGDAYPTGEQDQYDIKNWFEVGNFSKEGVATQRMTINHRDIQEDNITAGINFELPISFNDDWTLSLKTGAKYSQLNRVRDNGGYYNRWYYQPMTDDNRHGGDFPGAVFDNGVLLGNTFTNGNYSPETINGYNFYNPYDIDRVVNFIDRYNSTENGYFYNMEEAGDNLEAIEKLTAGYFMAKLKYKSIFTIIPGVRIENSNNVYHSFITNKFDDKGQQFAEPVTNSQDYTEVLPHLHLKFEPAQWYKLRFSAAKTLARPNYNYVAKSSYQDLSGSVPDITEGNTELKHMTSMNYDLSMSFHNGRYGLLTIGGFYKDIENISYVNDGLVFLTDSMAEAYGHPDAKGTRYNSYENSPEAKVYGFEADLQTSLKFLPMPFKGVVIGTNFTRLFSEAVKYGTNYDRGNGVFDPIQGKIVFPDEKNISVERKITIPGQVDLIFNISVGYEYKGFSMRLSGTHQGDYLDQPQIETTGMDDEYRLAFFRWDLAYKQKITDFMEFYFNAANLTNMVEQTLVSNYRFTQPNYVAYPDEVITGRTFTFGLRFNL